MNFIPNNPGSTMSTCVDRGGSECAFGGGITSQTPFLIETVGTCCEDIQLPEIVTDPSNGLEYYHMIIGDPADGFVQEVYIQRSASFGVFGTGWDVQGGVGGLSSASGGAPDDNDGESGNGTDPLDITALATGTGSGNPNRVIMRQIVNDGEMSMEFLKDKYDRKPVIAQSLDAPDITSSVVIDMRNSTYSDMNTTGTMLNTMSLLGPDAPQDQANFDMANDAQNSFVDAGRYTYTTGAGPGGSGGSYNYLGVGTVDMTTISWENFFNPDTSGPWSFTTNRPD